MLNDASEMTPIEEQAALWLVRLSGEDLRDDDLTALSDWLEASEAHRLAFERAEMAMLMAQTGLAEIEPVKDDAPMATVTSLEHARRLKNRPKRITPTWAIGGAIAAGFCLFGLFSVMQTASTHTQTLISKKGERFETALSDGTRLHLNSDTEVRVRLSGDARKLELIKGEVFVTVAYDPKRPLSLTAGDQVITDIGTQFNVARLDKQIRVSVREGLVDLTTLGAGSATAKPQRLNPGDESLHEEGTNAIRLKRVDPETASAWRKGRAIYNGETLAFVAHDLNRYLSTPLSVDPAIAALRVDAIIVLDSEDAIVSRLTAFAPVKAVRTDEAIRLEPLRVSAGRVSGGRASASRAQP